MCGIFGCLSYKSQDLISKTLQGLKILEYRGYDSAGIAYITPTELKTVKAVGEINQLAKKLQTRPATKVCIGHTRWATNGTVSIKNSHPHLSADGSIAIVHNGIIENYETCRQKLATHGIKLKTSVDTEVIPNILCYLCHNKHNIHNFLKGQYVFCMAKTNNNSLFIAKKGNLPLFIGHDDQTLYVTSDTLALPQTVSEIIPIDNLDTCEITDTELKFYNHNHAIKKTWLPFSQSFIASDKKGFSTYMEKEINEIPNVINKILTIYQQSKTITTMRQSFRDKLKTARCIHICGCGTSYHVALILAKLFERDMQIRTIAHISSELTASTFLNESAIAIVISQSGETADTLACMDILQEHNIPVFALCNVTTSTIAKRSQITFPLLCGPEIAVASTKVFCAAVLVGYLLINDYATKYNDDFVKETTNVLQNARQILPTPQKAPKQIIIIGKDIDYVIALEAALKIKEVSYVHCEGYPANELKHGPLSMVDNNTLAIVFGDNSSNAIAEIKARGGKIMVPQFPKTDNPLAFISKIIPAQIFALDLAQKLGNDPDKPRNLAKSVTVL